MKRKWKKYMTAAVAILCGLCITACAGGKTADILGKSFGEPERYFAEENQVKNTDGSISSFGLNIAPADEMGEWVVKWLENVNDEDGFQYYVYSDPDSWDVYLYYPKEQERIRGLTNEDVAVDFSDSTLKVYITLSDTAKNVSDDGKRWILHFAANPRGVWPTWVALYRNGEEVHK